MVDEIIEEVKTRAKEQVKKGIKKGVKKLLEWGAKILARFGIAFFVQDIPFVNIAANISFPCTRIVYRELEGNVTTPEGLLILPVGFTFDLAKIIVNIVELCFADADFTIVSVALGIIITVFFVLWIWIRGGGLTGVGVEKEDKKAKKKEAEKKKASGSENIDDWEQDEKGVWKMKEKKGDKEKQGTGTDKKEASPDKATPPPKSAPSKTAKDINYSSKT